MPQLPKAIEYQGEEFVHMKNLVQNGCYYYISRSGKCVSLKSGTPRLLKANSNNGYLRYNFTSKAYAGKVISQSHPRVHRLVAIAFLKNPNNYPVVNHKDQNIFNNDVSNLEWCSYKYNANYGDAKERAAKTRNKNERVYVTVTEKDIPIQINTKGIKCDNGFFCTLNGIVSIGKDGRALKLKETVRKDGYTYVSLRNNGKTKTLALHRILGACYLGLNPNSTMQIHHINRDKQDNRLNNLEVVTQSENNKKKHTNS